MQKLYIGATFIPLASFVILVLGGKRWGKLAGFIGTGAIATSFLLSTLGLMHYTVMLKPDSIRESDHGHGGGHGTAHGAHDDAHSGISDSLAKNPVVVKGSIKWATVIRSPGDSPLRSGISIGYRIDNITVLMFFMVTLVATCVHVYSTSYMGHEPRFARFFTYLSLFCFSMLALVMSDNLAQVFMCWELVGVCSYFLIGFYYEKRSASDAANKAFITNRVGDVGLIIGLMVVFAYFGTFSFESLFDMVRNADGTMKTEAEMGISNFWLTVAGIGIFVGCVGKSAQFPLHVWLPDAMEGPTPVSALIHAATMVAAGVYLVARSFPLFTPEALWVITYVGGITLFVAATIAITATDIKKALAYSTVSQLGYMMFALGIGGWVAGLMHLITHAFFKALMFLCSGSVIHGTGTQEMPQMGGLHKKMPITSFTMLIGVLAISGAPFFSGFYSKDAIIAQVIAAAGRHPSHLFIMLLPILTAGITAFYMFRLWFMTFTGTPRDHHVYDHAHESPPAMYLPLIVLAVLSVIGAGLPGWGLLERFIAFGEPNATNAGYMDGLRDSAHHAHGLATIVASIAALVGVLLAFAVYYFQYLNAADAMRQFPRLHALLRNKWYFDELYRFALVRPTFVFSKICTWIDKNVFDRLIDSSARKTVEISRLDGRFDLGIVDGIVNFVAGVVYRGGVVLHKLQTGWLRGYVLFIAVGSVGLFVLGAVLYF